MHRRLLVLSVELSGRHTTWIVLDVPLPVIQTATTTIKGKKKKKKQTTRTHPVRKGESTQHG